VPCHSERSEESHRDTLTSSSKKFIAIQCDVSLRST
jgi:hypothetical protein